MVWFVSQLLWHFTRRLLDGICKYTGERIVVHGPLVSFIFPRKQALTFHAHCLRIFSRKIIIFKMSQRTTKPTIGPVRPARTDQPAHLRSLIRVSWSHVLSTDIWLSKDGWTRILTKENPCRTGWMYRLIWVFAGQIGLTVGFVVRWLKYRLLKHLHSLQSVNGLIQFYHV